MSDTPASTHIATIVTELRLQKTQVNAVTALLAEGATVPFIARYRKEATGSLDEVQITAIRDRLSQLEEVDHRRQAILKSLEQHGHLTADLEAAVVSAETLVALEDIYLPYRPKRRTKGTIAKEKGLEPLAEAVYAQEGCNPDLAAREFVDSENGVDDIAAALGGARDIIAEWINEDQTARSAMRRLFMEQGVFRSTVATDMEDKGAKFKDYFDWQESAASAPSHRILAMRRGEKEDFLNLTIAPPEDTALKLLTEQFVSGEGADSDQVEIAVRDCYKRLLSRSMETEIRLATKERADGEAITIFTTNLRQLLLAPPLGAKRVLGLDPGFRTGCKLVCLDRQGKLLHHDTIYPHTSSARKSKAAHTVTELCRRYKIEAVAIGNGTAGRETESFVNALALPSLQVVLVNESGASIYSASEAAREEFPDLDLTVRGAVSIARRLMDPLAELVKIEPKSIGVGQYQHDVDQIALRQSLDDVVVSCVNSVGVDVNRASAQLLTYVSGLGPQLAKNIVAYRDENGPFGNRTQLKRVTRLGPKAFEQSAGFLRVNAGDNPLDKSAVHPESYPVVDAMAADLQCSVPDLLSRAELHAKIDLANYVTEKVGEPTLKDILAELVKPGRDPRKSFEAFAFADGVQEINDLREGMKLPGIITNITAFGAFVDIGVHQDGLVHISEMADRFVKDPAQIVKVHQKVAVTVLAIDVERRRISLSLKSNPGSKPGSKPGAGKAKKAKGRSAPKRPPRPKAKPVRAPLNNPFAEAFKKLSDS